MRARRFGGLVLLVAAAFAPSVAPAHPPSERGVRLLPPALSADGIDGGEAMGQAWALSYVDQRPPCLRLGRHGGVLVAVGEPAEPCAIDRRTAVLMWGYSATCDDLVPGTEFYAVGERAQRACAVALLRPIVGRILVTVDGRLLGDIHARRFAISTPQITLPLPSGDPSRPGRRATLTGYGWTAWLDRLPPGRHVVRSEATIIGQGVHVDEVTVDVRDRNGG